MWQWIVRLTDGSRSIGGMKIIPLQTSELATILKDKLNYTALYRIFDAAYDSVTSPNLWYKQEIAEKLNLAISR